MTKLHLGCGQTYLEGYMNIDFPQEEHTVQQNVVADKHADMVELVYPDNSIEEIRSHHVFEHFSRPTALALLCRWRDFLKPGGLLRIETPDVEACFKMMSSRKFDFGQKQQVMRHIFGSHEAAWAFHADGWYKEKFKHVLTRLGFCKLRYSTNRHGLLRNIEVFANKSEEIITYHDYYRSVEDILTASTVKDDASKTWPEGSEADMLNIWKNEWQKVYTLSRRPDRNEKQQ